MIEKLLYFKYISFNRYWFVNHGWAPTSEDSVNSVVDVDFAIFSHSFANVKARYSLYSPLYLSSVIIELQFSQAIFSVITDFRLRHHLSAATCNDCNHIQLVIIATTKLF